MMSKPFGMNDAKAFAQGMFGGSFLAHLEAQDDPNPMTVFFNKSTALLLCLPHRNQGRTALIMLKARMTPKLLNKACLAPHFWPISKPRTIPIQWQCFLTKALLFCSICPFEIRGERSYSC
ncbi:MAG: hypothetical protein GY874_10635 [Desulfobacteraceae bacterium]|nr:hypothetical protein [Desulfobacteraceae bacterium]